MIAYPCDFIRDLKIWRRAQLQRDCISVTVSAKCARLKKREMLYSLPTTPLLLMMMSLYCCTWQIFLRPARMLGAYMITSARVVDERVVKS